MTRVVTLLPSATEIVCALGQEGALVGRSHECDFPPSVKRLPVLTAPKLPVAAPSAEIDRAVKGLVAQALSIYEVDAAQLAALQPDVVVTQSQCEVCAVSESDVVHALAAVTGSSQPRLVSLAPRRLDDVWHDLERVGEALGVDGRPLASRLRARLQEIAALVAGRPRPRVACLEWLDPPMGAGNWVPELIELAGGEPLFGKAGEHSGWITFQDLAAAAPDVIFLMPCGFDLARTRAELAALPQGWSDKARVFLVDGNQYFNRPGPRLVDSLEVLVEALWGLDLGRGDGWQPL